MQTHRAWKPLIAYPAILVAGVACGGEGTSVGPDGEDNGTVPQVGSVQVTTSTTGIDLVTDGYMVTVASQSKPIGPNASVTFSDVPAGSANVELSGIAANCSVGGDNPNSVNVSAGATVQTTFDVQCLKILTETKLTASDRAEGDWFGFAVSATVSQAGDYAIVGAPQRDNTRIGSAYVFRRDGETWIEQAKLTASDGAPDDEFGYAVSIDGDYVIVGAPQTDKRGPFQPGAAYVFKRDGDVWMEQAKLAASDASSGDVFGWSVSIDGDYAIVGARGEANMGAAYVFMRDMGGWTEQAKLTASDGAENDTFGWSASISGEYALVGAQQDDSFRGSAYVFKRDGVSWMEQAKLVASGGASNDLFGRSVSIDQDYAVVGGSGNRLPVVHIFKRDGEAWTEQATLAAGAGIADRYGYSVSIDADYVMIGAFGTYGTGGQQQQGAAYLFKREGSDWVEQATLTASDGSAFDGLGWSVAIAVSMLDINLIAGAPGDDGLFGSAYVYR